MPAKAKFNILSRSLLFRTRCESLCGTWPQGLASSVRCRAYSEKPISDRPFEDQSQSGKPKGPNTDPLPHVSEEAAALKKSMGEQGPEIEQQGSPVSEVVKGDKEAQDNLPKVMKDQIKNQQASAGNTSGSQAKKSFSTMAGPRQSAWSALSTCNDSHPSRSRSFSTASRALAELQHEPNDEANMQALQDLMAQGILEDQHREKPVGLPTGLKFDLPKTETGKTVHLRKRYESIVDQVTKNLMKDGKLSVAQTNMNKILTHLRTSPAPRPSERAALVPGAPPLTELPLNPIVYLTVAIDSIAPIIRMKALKGIAGGGMSLQIPIPMVQRQRRRTAIAWILDEVDKKKGGISPFAKRFAEELVSIVEGRSSLWERRATLHSQGTRSRANLAVAARRPGKKGGR